jgi:predicted phosphodiesterase
MTAVRRIALFSDIHGNDVALEAVLHDIETAGGVDEFWALGDLVALGPNPIRVLDVLTALPNVRILRGNTDRYTYTGTDRPPPSLEEARADASRLTALVECAGTFAWTQGVLSGGWCDWLEQLPLELRLELPDGTRMLGVHAAPGCDDGLGLLAGSSHAELLDRVRGCEADLVLGGHHHMPLDERVGDFHLVNLGSVSNPYAPDLRASYVLLHADEQGYRVEHRRVDYDRAAVAAEMHRLRHPGASYVVSHLSGERTFPH